MAREPLTSEQLDQARDAYLNGSTYAALAIRFETSETRVRKALCARVRSRPAGKRLIEVPVPELTIAEWQAGLFCRQIAERHGLAHHHYVARFLHAPGIDLRSRPARCKVPGKVLGAVSPGSIRGPGLADRAPSDGATAARPSTARRANTSSNSTACTTALSSPAKMIR
jgi:hypothetical protein